MEIIFITKEVMLFKTALFASYISVFWPFDINVIGPFFQSISTEKKEQRKQDNTSGIAFSSTILLSV